MIKFNCIIHKETGTVIKYEDWLKCIERQKAKNKESIMYIKNRIKFDEKMENLKDFDYKYKLKDMLFNDDFEIIYESEFTIEELISLQSGVGVVIGEYGEDEELEKLYEKIENIKLRCKNELF
jgi:hypothetical protein